jgi:hypothetical protein
MATIRLSTDNMDDWFGLGLTSGSLHFSTSEPNFDSGILIIQGNQKKQIDKRIAVACA